MATAGLRRILLGLGLIVVSALAGAQENPDPWEDFNRGVFAFNDVADRYVLRPITKTYRFITPDFVETGVSNVFSNVWELPSALNGLLQGKPKAAGEDLGRFVVNSTLGVVGLWDVAQYLGLEGGDQEDFGQTLAVWGFDQGPYLVLPFAGPSTVRDTMAMPVDWVSDPLFYVDHIRTRNTIKSFYYVDVRSDLMDLEKHVMGDRYVFIRDAYLQRRNHLVNDGEVEDDFGSGYDDFGDY